MELERLKQMGVDELSKAVARVIGGNERAYAENWNDAMNAAERFKLFEHCDLWRGCPDAHGDPVWCINRLYIDEAPWVHDPSGPRAICMAILILAEEQ